MKRIRNRVTEMLLVEIPIVQAPMGWIARAQLASAVSNAGAMGIIETSSGRLEEIRDEIRKMRDLTDRPFGVNIAQAFVRDPGIVDFVVEQGVKFVTTSAGDPANGTRRPACARCAPSARRGSSATSTSGWRSSDAPPTSTSAATWRPRSRSRDRWSAASTR